MTTPAISSLRSRERLAQNEETCTCRGAFFLAVLERLELPRVDLRLFEGVFRREVDLERLVFERDEVDPLVRELEVFLVVLFFWAMKFLITKLIS
jgi:hypothetical protein